MSQPNHPSRQALVDFSLGKLPEHDLDRIGSHLEACPPCQDTLCGLELKDDTFFEAFRDDGAAATDDASRDAQTVRLAATAATAAAAAAVEGGDDLRFGPYVLQAPIGAGGMGEVYRAQHTKLGRSVALKRLPRGIKLSPERVNRFEREMRAVGSLHHENIVQAFDAGEVEGRPYLSMELLEGVDLASLVHEEGVLPVADACEVIRQAALGLHHAHQQGLVHRDVKPSNLMLTEQGVVKVLDLGLAGIGEPTTFETDQTAGYDGASEDDHRLTREGQLIGTPDYMSPEHCVGADTVTPESDIYSLGATLYFLLTGRAPFSGRAYGGLEKKLDAIRTLDAPVITRRRPDLPAGLVRVLSRMLDRRPSARFASADQVAEAIAPYAVGARLSPSAQTHDSADDGSYSPSGAPATSADGAGWRWRKALVGLGAAAAASAVWMMTLRTAEGTLVIEAPDDASHELQVVVSKGSDQAIADAQSGWALTLRQGEWKVELVDPSGEHFLSAHSVLINDVRQKTVKVAKRPPLRVAQAAPPAQAPPSVAAEPLAFELPDPLSAEWPLQVDLYTKAYPLDEEGSVEIDGLQWSVRDRYLGRSGDRTLIDERITLVLIDKQRGFWPVIIKMTSEAAEQLRDALRDAASNRNDDSRPGPLTATLLTKAYRLGASGRIALPEKVSWEGKAEHLPAFGAADTRPALLLVDEGQAAPPLVVRLTRDDALKIRRELSTAIRKKKSAAKQRVFLRTSGGFYVGVRRSASSAVSAISRQPKASEAFTLEWTDAQRLRGRLALREGRYLRAAEGVVDAVDAGVETPGASEVFEFEWLDIDRTQARLRTSEGHYLNANGGGGAGVNTVATAATQGCVFGVAPAR